MCCTNRQVIVPRLVRRKRVPRCIFLLALVLAAPEAECQERQGGDLSLGVVYLHMLETAGPGGELTVHWSLDPRVLGAESAIGFKLWFAQLGTPNSWMNRLRAAGIGVQWRSRWTLAQPRLRVNLSIPVQLVAAGTYGLQDLSLCVLTDEGEVCELNSGVSPAIGVGTGFELGLTGNVFLSSSINGFWSKLERTDDPAWYLFFGVGLWSIDLR